MNNASRRKRKVARKSSVLVDENPAFDYYDLTKLQLQQHCRENGIEYKAKDNKRQLIERIV